MHNIVKKYFPYEGNTDEHAKIMQEGIALEKDAEFFDQFMRRNKSSSYDFTPCFIYENNNIMAFFVQLIPKSALKEAEDYRQLLIFMRVLNEVIDLILQTHLKEEELLNSFVLDFCELEKLSEYRFSIDLFTHIGAFIGSSFQIEDFKEKIGRG